MTLTEIQNELDIAKKTKRKFKILILIIGITSSLIFIIGIHTLGILNILSPVKAVFMSIFIFLVLFLIFKWERYEDKAEQRVFSLEQQLKKQLTEQ